jgi:ubiquinone/menaquinone biosynthesis C-methylase UbiE
LQTIDLKEIQKQCATLETAERIFDSVVLFALFELGVFKLLSSGPKSLDEIHRAIGGSADTLLATLDAAVALRVLSKQGSRYAAPQAYLDCLGREDSPAYLGEWVAFLHSLAKPLLQLDESIRTGQPPAALFEEDVSPDKRPAKRMTKAMNAYARTRGIELVDKVDFAKTRRLLDLGCGPGTYSIAIMERNPQVRATLLDLPGPISEARQLHAKSPLLDRIEFVASDAMDYKPDQLFDTLLLSNTLHMIGPEGSKALLKHCYGLIAPGGRIIVQAQYLNDDRTSPRWPTLLNLFQRVGTQHGRNHAIGETTDWLMEAGFENIQFVRFSLWNVCSCLVGAKPN